MWASVLRRCVLAIALIGIAGTPIVGDDGGYKLIVHPDNPYDSVDREFVRDAYLKKATEWNDGEAIRPIDLAPRFPARDKFTENVIRKTPAQLRTYWNQQIFSGKGVPPVEAESVQDAIGYVVKNRGAIGYIPADVDPGRAKVLRIR
jgi:ABC-type phosphate transport system substrate-binding protein